jgi:molybdenum cofactor guanylyltransferase
MDRHAITALILAGGRGSRMGGVDKGLQNFNGLPLALHTLLRLQQQEAGLIGDILINANRNLGAYEAFGVPVWPDTLPDYAGPLAGFLTGLEARMANQLEREDAEIAMATAPEAEGAVGDTPAPARPQPVFCLMPVHLLESLVAFTQDGGRKIDRWTARHKTTLVLFDRPQDDPRAFFNANTLDELQRLESST